jgi:hypothetical protein
MYLCICKSINVDWPRRKDSQHNFNKLLGQPYPWSRSLDVVADIYSGVRICSNVHMTGLMLRVTVCVLVYFDLSRCNHLV